MTLFVTKRETPIGEVVARRSERGPVSMRFSDGKTDVSADRVDPDPAVGDAIDRYFAGSTAALGAEVGTSGRVVGNAMSANPVCLALPCHRVIRSDGTWHGYAYGNDRKRWLLAHEAEIRTPSGPVDPLGE